MRTRLTLTIVGAIAATLVLAGVVTLVVARIGARQSTEDELRTSAEAIAAELPAAVVAAAAGTNAREGEILQAFRRALRIDGTVVVRLGGARLEGELPESLAGVELDVAALERREVVSGTSGGTVYAAAPLARRRAQGATLVLVLTDEADVLLGPAQRWFLVAALVTLAVGAVVATRLGRRLSLPLRDADEATRRIAAGDLSVRLPTPDPDATDELSDLARSINEMAGALERSRGLERQFLLSVSHDLRTPLTSIQGYAEALADGTVTDRTRAGEVILAEARRLDRLVRDLLDLARFDARRFTLDLEPVDLAEVTAGVLAGFRPEAEDAGVRIVLEAADGPTVVAADTDRLAQVVANLVENALKFARYRIDVTTRSGDERVELAVTDDGPGIDRADISHVFERLYVARHDPRRKETGSGLGLAIVRELVTAMGGDVAAEPRDGGARLVVRLPRPVHRPH